MNEFEGQIITKSHSLCLLVIMHGVPGLFGFPFECLSEPVNRGLKTFFKRNLGFPAKPLPGKVNGWLTLEWIILG